MALGDKVQEKFATVDSTSWPNTLTFNSTATAGNLLVLLITQGNDPANATAPTGAGTWNVGPKFGLDNGAASMGAASFWKESDGTETSVTTDWSSTYQGGQTLFVEIDATGLDLSAVYHNNDTDYLGYNTRDTLSASSTTDVGLAVAGFVCDNATGGRYISGYSNGFSEIASGSKTSGYSVPQLARKVLSASGAQNCVGTLDCYPTSDQAWGFILVFDALVSAPAAEFEGTCPVQTTVFGGLSNSETRYRKLSSPLQGVGYLQTDPPLITGDLLEHASAASGYAVDVLANASWTIAGSPPDGQYSFAARAFTDGVPGPWATQYVFIVTDPSITSVNSDNRIYHNGSFVIAGTGFGASQGASRVVINGVTQAVTAWGDTSITFTANVPAPGHYLVHVIRG